MDSFSGGKSSNSLCLMRDLSSIRINDVFVSGMVCKKKLLKRHESCLFNGYVGICTLPELISMLCTVSLECGLTIVDS